MIRILKVFLVIAVTVAIFATVVYFVGFDETLAEIANAGVIPFLAVGGLYLIFIILQAESLAVLSRPLGHKIAFRNLLEATTAGLATNFVTPSTYLGGEPVKVLYIGNRTGLPYGEVTGTIVLGKYLEAFSFVFFLIINIVVATVMFRDILFSQAHIAIGISLLVIGLLGILLSSSILYFLLRHRKPLTAIVCFLARPGWFRRFFARLRSRCEDMETQVSTIFIEEGRASVLAFLLYFTTHIALFMRPLLFFGLGWNIGVSFELLCLIFIASQLLLAVQVTPSSVGVLDGGLIGVIMLVGGEEVGISKSMTVAYLLCLRVWDALIIAGGACIAGRAGLGLLSSGKKGQEPGEQSV